MIDPKLTQDIRDWLEAEPSQRDILAGALMLLQLNRNRILYDNIVRRPEKFAEKLEYELGKHLRIRLEQMTLQEVAQMQEEVMTSMQELSEQEEREAQENSEVHSGKAAFHDQLPKEIQALYERNGEIWPKMKLLYNELTEMYRKGAQPCDTFEKLKILADLDKEYRQNWESYDAAADSFQASEQPTASAEMEEPATPTQDDTTE